MDLLSVMQSQSMEGTDASCHHSPTTAAGEALVQQSGGQTKKSESSLLIGTVNFQSRGLPFSCKDHCDTIMSVDSVLACLASEALDLEKKLASRRSSLPVAILGQHENDVDCGDEQVRMIPAAATSSRSPPAAVRSAGARIQRRLKRQS
ncbi:Os11g0453600 [Oryza sativa Japonica Group]|uniref:Os11g0453600 protein n=1 Tax=Oryza sativa subsp. japonica TaxID=39947 RepID=A0A0P0Y1W8_ORYSJ|nr:hypothetical protein EE612_055364 [Oryza sativa]BAT13911.1 Os11g0453600 [Oryza sativa Japonica Group]